MVSSSEKPEKWKKFHNKSDDRPPPPLGLAHELGHFGRLSILFLNIGMIKYGSENNFSNSPFKIKAET